MTSVQWLDLGLVAVVLLQAVVGWRHGLITSALGVVGYLVGAALAVWGLSSLLARTPLAADPVARTLVLVIGVLLIASAVHGVTAGLGERLMGKRRRSVGGRVDSAAGAVVNAALSALVLALVGTSLIPVLPSTWRPTVQNSRVITAGRAALPEAATQQGERLTQALSALGFPRVFGDPSQEPQVASGVPDAALTRTPAIQRARGSVVKIASRMTQCQRSASGSGWVAAPHRVVTNAHVVAGADRVTLQPGGTGRALAARVIAFDPEQDVAVLDVPDLTAPALQLAEPLRAGDDAVVAGFPGGGAYDLEPARVGGTVQALGRDIYDAGTARRQIYAVAANVRPGNSGGPLLTTDGKVAGTVFAKSFTGAPQGFVLTNETTAAARRAVTAGGSAVATGACAKG